MRLEPEGTVLQQIVDGFSYNTMLFPMLPCRYFPNALAQMDVLRRAANFRARWFCIPDDIDQPIQPYATLYYQIRVAYGAYIYGYQFSTLSATDPSGNPVATTASDILVEAVDSCTGIPLFQDYANGGGCHSNFTSRCVPILLTQPRLILEPGLVNTHVSNRTPNTIYCQLLVQVAEPCRLITELDRQKEWALIEASR